MCPGTSTGSDPRGGGGVAAAGGAWAGVGTADTGCGSRPRSPDPPVVGGSWLGAASGVGSSPSVAVASSIGSSLRSPTRSRSLGMSRRGTATIPSASLTQWPAALPARSSTVTGTPCAGLPVSWCTMRNSQTSPMTIRGHQYAIGRLRHTTTADTLRDKALPDKALRDEALSDEAWPKRLARQRRIRQRLTRQRLIRERLILTARTPPEV